MIKLLVKRKHSYYCAIRLAALIICLKLDFSFANDLLNGEHVCIRNETVQVPRIITRWREQKQTKLSWCSVSPSGCTIITSKRVAKTFQIMETKIKEIRKCCDGYKIDDKGEHCIPICAQKCYYGKFIGPDDSEYDAGYCCVENKSFDPCTGEYVCNSGWMGELCNVECGNLTYGSNCSSKCLCFNNATCSKFNGDCICAPGFSGSACQDKCPLGHFGENCSKICECKNDGICSHVTGKCSCAEGWKGNNCEKSCDANEYGRNCIHICPCLNEGTCDSKIGNCSCSAGYVGKNCESKCTNGYFGNECKYKCNCHRDNTKYCDHVDGTCVCNSYWQGIDCTEKCPHSFYGSECEKLCNCFNNSTCDSNGRCLCSEGWIGKTCNDKCPAGFFGFQCKFKCLQSSRIENMHENICDHITGEIIYKTGYFGAGCNKTYEKGPHEKNSIEIIIILLICTIILLSIIIIIIVIVAIHYFYNRQKIRIGNEENILPECITELNTIPNLNKTTDDIEDDPIYSEVSNLNNQNSHINFVPAESRLSELYSKVLKVSKNKNTFL